MISSFLAANPHLARATIAAETARRGFFAVQGSLITAALALNDWDIEAILLPGYDCASASPDFANGAVTGAFSYAAGASYPSNDNPDPNSPYVQVAANGPLPPGIGHNGGPPLDDELPGVGGGLLGRIFGAIVGVFYPADPLNEGEDAYMSSFNQTAGILKPGGQWIGDPGSSSSIRILSGGMQGAQQLFDQLTVDGASMASSYPGSLVSLPNGVGTVGLRTTATSGNVPTIDVNVPGLSVRELKFPQ